MYDVMCKSTSADHQQPPLALLTLVKVWALRFPACSSGPRTNLAPRCCSRLPEPSGDNSAFTTVQFL